MHVVHDDDSVCSKPPEDQLIKCLLQRQRMLPGRGIDEIFHAHEGAAELLVELAKDSGFAATGAAPKPENRAALQTGTEIVKSPLLRRAQLNRGLAGHKNIRFRPSQ